MLNKIKILGTIHVILNNVQIPFAIQIRYDWNNGVMEQWNNGGK